MAEKALTAVIQEAYIQGFSTRSVDVTPDRGPGQVLVQAMGMSGISKSQESRLCADIDDRVKAFLERPIEGPRSGKSVKRQRSCRSVGPICGLMPPM